MRLLNQNNSANHLYVAGLIEMASVDHDAEPYGSQTNDEEEVLRRTNNAANFTLLSKSHGWLSEEQMAEHLKIVRDTMSMYRLNDEILVENCIKALNSNTPLRVAMMSPFYHMTVLDMKTEAQYSMHFPLEESFKTHVFNSLRCLPQNSLRDYFGEKVVIYFAFLCYYRDRLLFTSLLGIVVVVIQLIYKTSMDHNNIDGEMTIRAAYKAVATAMAIIITLWCKSLEHGWMIQEQKFQVQFGQPMEGAKETRPTFVGAPKRNLVTDKVNSLEEDTKGKKCKHRVMVFVILLSVLLTIASSIVMVVLKRMCYANGWVDGESGSDFNDDNLYVFRREDGTELSENFSAVTGTFFEINELVFNIIEFCRIMIFQKLFQKIIMKMVRWLDLKYVEDHENYLIVILSMYQLLNNSVSIIFIALQALTVVNVKFYDGFTDAQVDADTTGVLPFTPIYSSTTCINGDCGFELANFFGIYCVLHLVFDLILYNVLEYSWDKLVTVIKKIRTNFAEKEFEAVDTIPLIKKKTSQKLKSHSSMQVPEEEAPRTPNTGGPVLHHPEARQDKNLRFNTIGKAISKLIHEKIDTHKEIQKERIDHIVHVSYVNPASVYEALDREINHQVVFMRDESTNGDYDTNLTDYLQIFNNYGYTTLFGIMFPISFLTCWIIGLVEFNSDRARLLYSTKRPLPQSAKSIGTWLTMIRLISRLAVWTNSYYIGFVIFDNKLMAERFAIFFGIALALMLIGQAYSMILNGGQNYMDTVIKRMDFIRGCIFNNAKSKLLHDNNIQIERSWKMFGGKIPGKGHVDLFDITKDANELIEFKRQEKEELEMAKGLAAVNVYHHSNTKGHAEPKTVLHDKSIGDMLAGHRADVSKNQDHDGSVMSRGDVSIQYRGHQPYDLQANDVSNMHPNDFRTD